MTTIAYVDRVTPAFIDQLNENFAALEAAIDEGAASNLFQPSAAGLGILIDCTNSPPVPTALVGTGDDIYILNVGVIIAFLAFGDNTVVPTTAHMAIPPGVPMTIELPLGTTYVAGITLSGDTQIQITRGSGRIT